MKRAMCIYLPQWPLQRLRHERPDLRDQPIAIAQPRTARGAAILFCNRLSAHAGIRSGMPVAEARAREPSLRLFEADPEGDLARLEKLAKWAEKFTPRVGLEEGPTPHCLLLDITGCEACFRGEKRLARLAMEGLKRQGWVARLAIADTVGAAWGLARYGVQKIREGEAPDPRLKAIIAPAGQTREAVEDLPLAAMRLSAGTLDMLAKLGVERVGELLALPRTQMAIRFSPEVLRRLDQMLGRVAELVEPCRFPAEVQARCDFEYPTARRAFLDHAFDRLLDRIVEQLQECNRGARRLECWFFHETSEPHRVEVRLFRPTMSADHLREMLRTRMETVRLQQPVSALCLRVAVLERISERQGEWYETDASPPEELAGLIDRLTSKLGRQSVTFAKLVSDPQPEYACRFESVLASEEKRERPSMLHNNSKEPQAGNDDTFSRRPMVVLPSPEPIEVEGDRPTRFRRGGREYWVTQAWGPERIETGWWRGADIGRDYYIAETLDGSRWWLFRRLDDGRWFLHGCFE